MNERPTILRAYTRLFFKRKELRDEAKELLKDPRVEYLAKDWLEDLRSMARG